MGENAVAAIITAAYAERDARVLRALEALVAETERCDRPGLYGVGSDEPVMHAAHAAIAELKGDTNAR
jgi:hypothetical protein